MRRLSALFAVLAVALGSGCGDGPGAGSSDLAKLAPSGSVFYGEVTLRPEGERKQATSAYFGRILDSENVGEEVAKLLDRALSESDRKLSYTKDIEPWLGDDMAGFLSSVTPEPQGALVLQTTDSDAAEKTIDKLLGADAKKRTHEDVEYQEADDVAAGIVDGSVVIGTEDGVKDAIEASAGRSLDEDEDYQKALEGLEEERLAHFYVDGRKLLDGIPSAAKGLSGGERETLRRLGETTGAASLTMTEDAASFDFRGSIERLRSLGFLGPEADTNASPTLKELPAGALVAYAFPDLGGFIEAGLDDPGRLGVTEEEIAAARTGLKSVTGQDLDELVTNLGDARFFVLGNDEATLDFGAVLESPSPEKQMTALRTAARKLPPSSGVSTRPVRGGLRFTSAELPAPITVTTDEDGLVVSFRTPPGDVASPTDTLDDHAEFQKGVGQLGEDYRPTAFVDIAGLLALAESFGASEDGDYKQAKRYLDELGSITFGDRTDGEDSVQRVTIGLK